MSLLRGMFGPSKQEIWRQLCAEIGADYVAGSFWKGDKVQVVHQQWTVTLDIFSQTISTGKTTTVIQYTRLRAPFVNPDQFRFRICRRSIFSDLAQWFGAQDVQVGHSEFDRDFVIKGTDEQRLRAFFDNPKLRELIAAQPRIDLSVKDDEGWFGAAFPEGVDELQFMAAGVIKDVAQLKLLFELFAEALEQLCRIGSAYTDAPNVKL